MIFNLYAFTDRFGNWSQPFLAHDDEEACALIKEGLKGKTLSYAEKGKKLFRIAYYDVVCSSNPLEIIGGYPVCISEVDVLLDQKGSVENVEG